MKNTKHFQKLLPPGREVHPLPFTVINGARLPRVIWFLAYGELMLFEAFIPYKSFSCPN